MEFCNAPLNLDFRQKCSHTKTRKRLNPMELIISAERRGCELCADGKRACVYAINYV